MAERHTAKKTTQAPKAIPKGVKKGDKKIEPPTITTGVEFETRRIRSRT
jgi:hypothetical protein